MATTKAERARRAYVNEALRDEMLCFNCAIENGKRVILHTFNGDYLVAYVTPQFEYFTPTSNGGFGNHWAGCNDSTWANLMRQAGVARHSMWARLA